MKVVFLGINGSLQGIDSGNVSLIVSHEGTSVLVDVSGSPAQSLRMAGYNPIALDAVVLTHAHIDHIYGLPSLLHNLWLLKRKNGLRVFGNAPVLCTAHALCEVFGIESKQGMFHIQWTEFNGKRMFLGTGMTIQDFPVTHGVPTNGCVFSTGERKIVYCADCTPMAAYPGSTLFADLLIHEAGGLEKEESELTASGHSSGRQAGIIASLLQAKQLLLCHLPLGREHREAVLHEAEDRFPSVAIPRLLADY